MSLQSAPVRQSQSTGPGGWTRQSGGGRSSGHSRGGGCDSSSPSSASWPGGGAGGGDAGKEGGEAGRAEPWGSSEAVSADCFRGRRSRGKACESRGSGETRQGSLMRRGWGGGGGLDGIAKWKGTLLPGMEVRREMDEESVCGVVVVVEKHPVWAVIGLNISLLWCKPN